MKDDAHHQHLFRCDCDDLHFVVIDEWDDDGMDDYFSIEAATGKATLRQRFKDAWKTLLGRRVVWEAVILTNDVAQEMATILQAIANKPTDRPLPAAADTSPESS